MGALLGEPGVVDDPGRRPESPMQLEREPPPERLPGPGTLADELLQVLLVAIGQARDHRPDALPLTIEEQPAEVDATPVLTLAAAKRAQHLDQETLQALPDTLHLFS